MRPKSITFRLTLFFSTASTAVLLVVGAWGWLNVYTRHNAKAVVPELKGLTLDEARARLAERYRVRDEAAGRAATDN